MRLETERRDRFAWSELAPVTLKRFALGAPLRKETPQDKPAIRDAICAMRGNHVPWSETDYDLWDALVLAEACRLSMKDYSEIEPLGRIRMTILERLGDGLL